MPIKRTARRKTRAEKPAGVQTARPRVRRPRLFLNPKIISESSFQAIRPTHLEYPFGRGNTFKYTAKPGDMVLIRGNRRKNRGYALLGQVLTDNELRITHVSEGAGNRHRTFKKLEIHHRPGETREFTEEFHFRKSPEGLPFAEATISLGPLRNMHLTNEIRAEIIKPAPIKPKKQPVQKSKKRSA